MRLLCGRQTREDHGLLIVPFGRDDEQNGPADGLCGLTRVNSSSAPHLLVSDIGMPGVDGYELLRRIRSLQGAAAEVPAIALTAFARPKERMNALRAGYVAHLVKPADPSQLIATVAAAARRGGV